MAHAQKPDFVFRRNGRVHLNRRGRRFSRLLAAEVCASALVMLDTPRSEVVWEYWLPAPFASFPITSPPVRHRVPSGFKRTLQLAGLERKFVLGMNCITFLIFMTFVRKICYISIHYSIINIGILKISGTLKMNPLKHCWLYLSPVLTLKISIFFTDSLCTVRTVNSNYFSTLTWMSLAFETLNIYCKLGTRLLNTCNHKMRTDWGWNLKIIYSKLRVTFY